MIISNMALDQRTASTTVDSSRGGGVGKDGPPKSIDVERKCIFRRNGRSTRGLGARPKSPIKCLADVREQRRKRKTIYATAVIDEATAGGRRCSAGTHAPGLKLAISSRPMWTTSSLTEDIIVLAKPWSNALMQQRSNSSQPLRRSVAIESRRDFNERRSRGWQCPTGAIPRRQ